MPAVIADAVTEVRARVIRAAERAARDPRDVRIVAVGKGVPAERIVEAVEAGISELGENRAQELRDKMRLIGDAARWHFVGALQSNKVRYLDRVHLVHSLDRPEEAEALQRRGDTVDRTWDALIEVNVAGETSKQGVEPAEVGPLIRRLSSYPRVRPRGFMVVAPVASSGEDVRWVFAETRRLRDLHRDTDPGLEELSMGMSDDFEVAVEEGATLVRIGRAIFQGV